MSKIIDEIIKLHEAEEERNKKELPALMRSRLINVLGKYGAELIQNEDPSRFTIPESNWDLGYIEYHQNGGGFYLFKKGFRSPYFYMFSEIKIDSVETLGKYLKKLTASKDADIKA